MNFSLGQRLLVLRDQHFLAETPAVFLKSIMALHVGGHESNIFPMDMASSRYSDLLFWYTHYFFLAGIIT